MYISPVEKCLSILSTFSYKIFHNIRKNRQKGLMYFVKVVDILIERVFKTYG
jgi:hypothetical protein